MAKTIVFIAVWLLLFLCGIYLFGAIFMGTSLSTVEIIIDSCGFVLSILWLWLNTVVRG